MNSTIRTSAAPLTTVHYRPFLSSDLPALVAGFNCCAPVDAVTERTFAENTVLDESFRPEGLLLAHVADQLVGAIYAVRPAHATIPVPADHGWITFLFVLPAFRGQGIGSQLIAAALTWLRDRGAVTAEFAGYPPAYFVPGLDAQTYPKAALLLQRAGFAVRYEAVAMDLSLATYAAPDEVESVVRQRVRDGYSFDQCAWGDIPEVCAFACEHLAPDWGGVVAAAVRRSGRPDRVLAARNRAGSVIGFATYGSYSGSLDRFGPFGVQESVRGLGIGRILLHRTLGRMRQDGTHSAWFLWTSEHSPAGHLYTSTGFAVTRTFQVMRVDL